MDEPGTGGGRTLGAQEAGQPGSTFSLVDPDGLRELVKTMKDGSRTLQSALGGIRTRFVFLGLPTDVLGRIDAISEWIDTQLPGLERRRNDAERLAAADPDKQQYLASEPPRFETPKAAEEYGRRIARELFADDEVTAADFDRFLQQVKVRIEDALLDPDLVHDPDIMAGFFLELGPHKTEMLPTLLANAELANSQLSSGQSYLELFSIGLGTALSTTNDTSSSSNYENELRPFRQHFLQPSEEFGWDRLALLQHGTFPSDWVAHVVYTNALADLNGDDWADVDYSTHDEETLGLSGNRLALAFNALSEDPTAARLGLDVYPDIALDRYIDRVGFLFRSKDDDADSMTVAESFSWALAAGSGALDDPPDKGQRASEFAFNAIMGLNQDSMDGATWQSTDRLAAWHDAMGAALGQIAATYAEELLLGTQTQDDSARTSSLDRPEGFEVPFEGMEPTFYLSQEDVYKLLYRLGTDDSHSAELGRVVHTLSVQLPGVLEADITAMLNRAFIVEVQRGDTLWDLAEKHLSDPTRWTEIADASADTLQPGGRRLTDPNLVLPGWRLTIPAGNGSATETGAPNGELPGVESTKDAVRMFSMLTAMQSEAQSRVRQRLGRDDADSVGPELAPQMSELTLIKLMVDNGYPYSEPLPDSLRNADGTLLSPGVVNPNEQLTNELYDWLERNDETVPEHPHMLSFFDTFVAISTAQSGGGQPAEQVADNAGW